MTVKHLSEDQIQTYLDGCDRDTKRSIEAHLADCPQCTALLNDYKRLYVALADDRDLVPVKDLPTAVLARAGLRPRPGRKRFPIEIQVGVAGIAVAVLLAFYFLDLTDAIVRFAPYLPQLIRETGGQVTALQELTVAYGPSLILATFAGMILTIVAVLDSAGLRRRSIRRR